MERVLIVQAVAIAAWLLCIPCCYFGWRRADRLRSSRGAIARAATDGFGAWVIITVFSAGIWLAEAYAPGEWVHMIPVLLSIVVAQAVIIWFSPFVLKFFARISGG
ncbi:MAG: hypothetical protein ABIO86_03810 [Sphingomonas sp.]